MKLSNNVIEDVVSQLIGEDAIPVVLALKNKKNVSEFKLAESLKKEVNETRNILYRLYEKNLVSFTRKKDKKKGWYIYYWTFNLKRLRQLTISSKQKKLEKLNQRLEREKQNQFFLCPNRCIRLEFDQAMDFQFKCPECGEIIQQEDNTEKIDNIKKEIKELEKELKPPKRRKKKK
ncbi:transcription factor [Candidatus Woesearchaeota archaeon]|nr:transcription factor [Candidatus Woesearchaeota archaeon]